MFNQMDYTEWERRARLSASATKRSTDTRKQDTARCQSAGQTADGYGKEANSSNSGNSSTNSKHTTTMKANIIYIAYGLVFLIGMFGLFAIAESDLSLAATLYGIAGIFAVLYFGAKGINKLERE